MKALLLHFRTFLFSLFALGFLVTGLYLCLRYPQAGIAIFTAFAGAVVCIVAAVAGKSAVEHLGNGTGLKGMWAALTTDAKPGDPPKPPGQAGVVSLGILVLVLVVVGLVLAPIFASASRESYCCQTDGTCVVDSADDPPVPTMGPPCPSPGAMSELRAYLADGDPARLAVIAVAEMSPSEASPCRADGHNQHRSRSELRKFKQHWANQHRGLPCPETCQTYIKRGDVFVPYERCGACAVDHVCALACWNPRTQTCGPDAAWNMRWLDKKENGKKSDDCTECGGGP